jgi:hypothetical protein
MAESTTPHKLYVWSSAGGPGREAALGVLRYLAPRAKAIAALGVKLEAVRVRTRDLRDPRFMAALRRRGVTRLPALVTPNGVYEGGEAIRGVYGRNLQEFARAPRAEEPADLDSFFRSEMSLERVAEDAREGAEGDMMDSYRHMMERREAPAPAGAAPPGANTAPPGRAAPAAQGRADNVGAPGEDAALRETFEQLAQDIDGDMRNLAFSSGGGDSLDDGGAADLQDDLMERAYYANLSASDEL